MDFPNPDSLNPRVSRVLIVGAGLAGVHLAWALRERSLPFDIISHDFGRPAWRASAGIINPITGKRVVKSWNIDTLLPAAVARYDQIAATLDVPNHFTPKALLRYFRGDDDEIARLHERLNDPEYRPYKTPTSAASPLKSKFLSATIIQQ